MKRKELNFENPDYSVIQDYEEILDEEYEEVEYLEEHGYHIILIKEGM